MEPNNFEKDFREKLNQRTIEPSNKAWDRLDAMLSIAEEKQPKKNYKWLYIAASIVGFLVVGTFFFNQKKNVVETPKNNVAVEEVTKKDSVIKPTVNRIDSGKIEIVASEKATIKRVNTKEANSNPDVSVQKSKQLIKNEKNQIAESSIIIKNNQEKQTINNQTSVVETSKNENVDQLLNAAEKTVVAEHSVRPKSKIKINASDLLNQVDGELETSFREKVITKVNKNYQTVKVALANRNQEE
ncbi:hypothetical protein SD960_07580 [Flavobacterium sp. MMLR14_040]|uniref:hypothetical protein n=1 Tax=Flavobacterium sp. MMLR14_040 TaxID=3093843 RepID=UPI0029903FF3|nr:hypothetical protein [Flavobacterium sp. MMLR14_040]MDW8849946.1 hypothetical protein [Flavobacterium sp. MMLR14_040]